MSFSGTVSKASHEEGLLIAFEGRAPKLGATIRVVGGKTLGRVETVIGSADNPLIHIHPLPNSVDARSAIGSPVEIAPSGRFNRGRQDRRLGESKFRRGRDSRPGSRRGNNQRGRDRKFGDDRHSSMKRATGAAQNAKTTISQTRRSAIELVVKSRNREVVEEAGILVVIDLVIQVVSETQI